MLTTSLLMAALASTSVLAGRTYKKCATLTAHTNQGVVALELGSKCDWIGCDQDIWYVGPKNFNGVKWTHIQVAPGATVKFHTNEIIDTYWRKYTVWDGRQKDNGWYSGRHQLNMVSCEIKNGNNDLRTCGAIYEHHSPNKGKGMTMKIECDETNPFAWAGCSQWSTVDWWWYANASRVEVHEGCTVWLYYGTAWGYLTWTPGNKRINGGDSWNFNSDFNDNLYKWWCSCQPRGKTRRRADGSTAVGGADEFEGAAKLDQPESNEEQATSSSWEPVPPPQVEENPAEMLAAVASEGLPYFLEHEESDDEMVVEGQDYPANESATGEGTLTLDGVVVVDLPDNIATIPEEELSADDELNSAEPDDSVESAQEDTSG